MLAKYKSIKKDDFIEMLKMLFKKVSPKRSALLLDNCSVHRSKVVSKYLERNRVPVLWNLPYRPDLNGIELVWAQAKKNFRQILLKQMIDEQKINLMELAKCALDRVPDQVSKACAK